MKILHLACLNNDPEIQPNMGPKCNPVGGEPLMFNFFIIIFFRKLDRLLQLLTFCLDQSPRLIENIF